MARIGWIPIEAPGGANNAIGPDSIVFSGGTAYVTIGLGAVSSVRDADATLAGSNLGHLVRIDGVPGALRA
jgi:hypothetical protein